MSVLYAVIALAFCVLVTVGLRAFIVGDRFDSALHRVDPNHRDTRDMTRDILVDPLPGIRGLPQAYGRYSGATFRPVDDPEVERLRRHAVRAWVVAVILGLVGIAADFAVGALLRRISPGLDVIAVLVVLALLAIYWLRRLLLQIRETERSTMAALYIVGGVAAAVAAFVFVVVFPSRAL